MPSLMQQANIIFYRSVVKSINEGNALLLDVFLVVILGIILGAVQVGGSERGRSCATCWGSVHQY